MNKQTVSEKKRKSKALKFIRGLTPKQIGEVLGEDGVMFNQHLDCFFVWRDGRLVMYVNENDIPKLGPIPRYVEREKDGEIGVCDRCSELLLDVGFIRLDDGREFHYHPDCWPTKATTKTKE